MHKQCGVSPLNISKDISKEKYAQLIDNHKRCILFISDERSMISSQFLGACERNVSQTVFGGVCEDKDFGGIPVVILVGDDNQLPPVNINGQGKGAFYIFEKNNIKKSKADNMKLQDRGNVMFECLTDYVMEITVRTRQKHDMRFVKVLEELSAGKPSESTVNILMGLRLNNIKKDQQDVIKRKSIYIFAKHSDKNDHNNAQLYAICDKNNPLACLKYEDITPGGAHHVKCHFDINTTPLATHFFVGAKVCLKGRNIEPTWGVFNGTIGTVREIVYEEGRNPNYHGLPAYVAVEFPTYNPPNEIQQFDPENPKVRNIYHKQCSSSMYISSIVLLMIVVP